ncbi:hypothetical protein U1Q18_001438 [Sarracenia purpurea var. burkii]
MSASDLQIWNNAAFDNGDSEDTAITRSRSSWSSIKPILVNRSESSFDSLSSKENRSPAPGKSLVSLKTPAPVKPLHPNGAIGNSTNPLHKQGLVEKPVLKNRSEEEVRDERRIDAEIEEIQNEITRLSSRLEALRLEKAEQKLKLLEKRGRVVPAKFKEKKQTAKNSNGEKTNEEASSSLSARTEVQRRGFSLGPAEILLAGGGIKSRQIMGKQEMITPVQPIQNRRKSCFWKLQDIDEAKVTTKERGKRLSLSPKSRKAMLKSQPLRQAATTVGSRKTVKKEDIISTIQPKKLFRDGERSVPAAAKKSLKPGRVVASRYNSEMRKRSLPENDEGDSKRCDKKRASGSSVGISNGSVPEINQYKGTESRVKKRWEIPGEVIFHRSSVNDESPAVSAARIPDMLPKIRTVRCTTESPRDSGPAKRVVELMGRKSYFCEDEEVEPQVKQALSFAEDVEEEEETNGK